MSLSDDLIRQKQVSEAATESIKLRQQEWSKAIDALLSTIEEMLSPAIEAQAVSASRGVTSFGGQVSMPTLAIGRATNSGRLPIKPVIVEPVGMSRVRICGGAVVGHKSALSWSGSGYELSSWNVPVQSLGPRGMRNGSNHHHRVNGAAATLTQEMLESLLRRYLGLGEYTSA
jgi:hypothetical protein